MKFVHPVSPGGSVKFVASGVNFSIFTNFLCCFLLKLLKLGEIGGVKFLTWKSGGVKFWTNSMSDHHHHHPHQSQPNIKAWITAGPLYPTNKLSKEKGKGGATSWFLGPFFSCSTLLCVIMDTTCGKHSIHFTPIKKREWFHCNHVCIELRTSERLSELLRRTELCKSYCFSK